MLTLPTTPEIEARLQNAARKSGLSVEEFALQKLLDGLPVPKPRRTETEVEAALHELQRLGQQPGRLTPDEMRALEAEDKALDAARDRRLSTPYVEKVEPLSDAEFETAMNEVCTAFADVPFGERERRAFKEEEMALEEAKHARLFDGATA